MLSWWAAAFCICMEHLRAVCGRTIEDHCEGDISREYLAVLLNIAAQHDPCEAYTHLLQASAVDSTCVSTHRNLHTASLTAWSTWAKAKTLTLRSICCPLTSLVPRPCGRGKAAWYPLHVHAHNHPKSGDSAYSRKLL